jgi:hypothetical protein
MTTAVARKRVYPPSNGSVVPSCGLPAWVVCQLDALLSAGIVRADVIDALDADELTELAREAVRHALDGFRLVARVEEGA